MVDINFVDCHSEITHSKLHFFPNPQICLHIQRELHCNNLRRYNTPFGNSIFLEGETNYWKLIIACNNLIKPVFLVRNLDFLKFFTVFFHLGQQSTSTSVLGRTYTKALRTNVASLLWLHWSPVLLYKC